MIHDDRSFPVKEDSSRGADEVTAALRDRLDGRLNIRLSVRVLCPCMNCVVRPTKRNTANWRRYPLTVYDEPEETRELDMPKLLPGQTCQIWTAGPAGKDPVKEFETSQRLLSSPNWLWSGDALVLNGDGLLWRLSLSATRQLDQIVITGIPQVNNDHVLDPDGEHIYLSAYDRQVYRAPICGGAAELITRDSPVDGLLHFLHGVHPRGDQLAFIGLQPGPGNWRAQADVFTMSVNGGGYRRLTSGPGPSDGCEYSPDAEWIYFNTELFDGHAQIARIRPDGNGLEQLTFDEYVNWFPHISPDGRWAAYVSFPPGTRGHPSNVWVDVKIVSLDDWSSATTVAHLFGGQGTLNTPSWAPDNSAFAYVSYPTDSAD